jgi:hypothetical protein
MLVDPVNQYILSKSYTNKVKMSRLDRMKLISDRKKNRARVENFLKEKNKEEILQSQVSTDSQDEAPEVILKENIVKLTDDDNFEDINQIDQFLNEEIEEDEDWEVSNANYLNEEEDEEFEEDDLEEEEFNEDDYEEEELFTYNKDEEMDPSMLYFFVDCTDEELKELSEEDRKIIEAYRNSKKNSLLLKPRNKKAQKELMKKQIKKNSNLNFSTPSISKDEIQPSEILKATPNENTTGDELKVKTTPQKKDDNLNNLNSSLNNLNSQNKRKNSVTSNGSNSKKKKNVSFRFNSNQFNGKDELIISI